MSIVVDAGLFGDRGKVSLEPDLFVGCIEESIVESKEGSIQIIL